MRAAAKKLPMIFINAVAGCEEYNRIYFTEKGCATTASSVETLAELSISLLKNDAQREAMSQNFPPINQCNAAWQIFDYIKEKHK